MRRAVAPLEIYLDLFHTSLYQVGNLWEAGKVTVACEHLATAITEEMISLIFPAVAAAPRNGYRAVVSCSADELHQVGGRMVADVLEWWGWNTSFIGANTSVEQLLSIVQDKAPHIVALSVCIAAHIPRAVVAVEALRKARPDLPIYIGGQALSVDRSAFVGFDRVTRVESLLHLEPLLKDWQRTP